jgi:hypothetical protein
VNSHPDDFVKKKKFPSTMTKLFLIFNHEITDRQAEDAYRSLGVDRIIDLPPDLKDMWKSVPAKLPEIADYFEPVKNGWVTMRHLQITC